MRAVGAYFKALREHAGLTQDDVARQAGVSGRTYIRYEKGEIPAPGDVLAIIVDILGAAPAHVQYLSRRKDSLDERDGANLASQYLTSRDQQTIDRFIASVPDDQLDEIIEVSRRLQRDRGLLSRWLSFGRGLSER